MERVLWYALCVPHILLAITGRLEQQVSLLELEKGWKCNGIAPWGTWWKRQLAFIKAVNPRQLIHAKHTKRLAK